MNLHFFQLQIHHRSWHQKSSTNWSLPTVTFCCVLILYPIASFTFLKYHLHSVTSMFKNRPCFPVAEQNRFKVLMEIVTGFHQWSPFVDSILLLALASTWVLCSRGFSCSSWDSLVTVESVLRTSRIVCVRKMLPRFYQPVRILKGEVLISHTWDTVDIVGFWMNGSCFLVSWHKFNTQHKSARTQL